jgi:hypothetical protein
MVDLKQGHHEEVGLWRRDETLQAEIQRQSEANGEVVLEFGSCTRVESLTGCRRAEYAEHSRMDQRQGFWHLELILVLIVENG